LLAVFRINR